MNNKFKKVIIAISIILLIAILVIAILLVLYYKTDILKKEKYIKTAKRTQYYIQDVNDNMLDNYISKNKNTLVIFWASWCGNCTAEANDLNNFIINNPDIPVIIVSHDKELNALDEYLNKNNYNWFVIYDTNKTIREKLDPGSKGIPSTYLLNKKGEIIDSHKGSFTEEQFKDFYNKYK